MTIDDKYMHRCLDLAKRGAGYVAPNPMVGAVLVYEDRIIGEGRHQQFGHAHAEVNCLASVKEEDRPFISSSVLYVSLEPCAHFGKTPPCSDLIIEHKIPKVVIGCADGFKEVNGKGIEKLKAGGVEVLLMDGSIKYEAEQINKRFITFHKERRPYIILKWAQTNNEKIAYTPGSGSGRLMISNDYTNRLVHKWRSEEAAILVGTNTALLDDPALTTKLWKGHSPIRLIIDLDLRLPGTLKIFNAEAPTIVFNKSKHSLRDMMTAEEIRSEGGSWYFKISQALNPFDEVLKAFYALNIQSVLVEGGAQLLQAFINKGTWDEIRVITNKGLTISEGLSAPNLANATLAASESFCSDEIQTYFPARAPTDR